MRVSTKSQAKSHAYYTLSSRSWRTFSISPSTHWIKISWKCRWLRNRGCLFSYPTAFVAARFLAWARCLQTRFLTVKRSLRTARLSGLENSYQLLISSTCTFAGSCGSSSTIFLRRCWSKNARSRHRISVDADHLQILTLFFSNFFLAWLVSLVVSAFPGPVDNLLRSPGKRLIELSTE